jgi:agmatinase
MIYLKKTFDYDYGIEEADVVLVGIPFDSTQTGNSVKNGPLFIREAIRNLPGHDPVLGKNIFENTKFADLGDVEVVPGNWQLTKERIHDTVKSILDKNPITFPVFLGGEHLITLGILDEIKNHIGGKITVIHFDAHRDLMPDWLGEKFSHITWAHHIANDDKFELVQIGCRSWNKEEEKMIEKVKEKIKKVNGPVYITVDLDVIDPKHAPEVGTPEPFGMIPEEFFGLLEKACQSSDRIIGMDIVECASHNISSPTAMLAANVFKKVIGWRR